MAVTLSSIAPVRAVEAVQTEATGPAAGGFDHVLRDALRGVEQSSAVANSAVQNFVSGGPGELHSAILAAQNAQLDLDMFLQVRNKVVSAYEEIMKMQV
ncbi:MAG: flagellar hook-basal body complex protein FliE [Acidobacteriaceae bacterium]|nr:flagellar hook-basal body complex protein FliE [Acidobacteriaceae bacterium]